MFSRRLAAVHGPVYVGRAGLQQGAGGGTRGRLLDVRRRRQPDCRLEHRISTGWSAVRRPGSAGDQPGPLDSKAVFQRFAHMFLVEVHMFLYLAGCNMSFRRSALVAIGGFNELLAYGYDDVEVCCRIVDNGQKIALLEDAIVNHDRAANSIRDSGQKIKDIYPFLFARIVFALQYRPAATSIQSLVSVFEDSARNWRTFARHRLDEGTFTAAEYVRFVHPIDEAIAAGALPRFIRIFVAQRKAAFHQYPTLPKSRSHAGRLAKSG